MDCIFCKIIKGEISSYTIYEDEVVKAILDVNPISKGHVLILPKQHFQDMYDIDLEVQKYIEMVSKKIGNLLKEKLNCVGITRVQNNEYGQEIKHYHMHIIPRYQNDQFQFLNSGKEMIKPEEVYQKILK